MKIKKKKSTFRQKAADRQKAPLDDVFVEFASPLLDFIAERQTEKLLSSYLKIAGQIWNAATPGKGPEALVKERAAFEAVADGELLLPIIDQLAERRRTLFAEETRQIRHVKVKMGEGEGFSIEVATL